MTTDIKSQINRAQEFLKDLKGVIPIDLTNGVASDRTKNLVQDILTKMRNVFDQTMYKFFKEKISSSINVIKIKRVKVYFPIGKDEHTVKSILGRACIKDLNIKHPQIYSFILSVQPFNENYKWMYYFSLYSNEKHIRLTPQKRREKVITKLLNALEIEDWNDNNSLAEAKLNDCEINGIPIKNLILSKHTPLEKIDPKLNPNREVYAMFTFEGTYIDVLRLCDKVVNEGEKIITYFLNLF